MLLTHNASPADLSDSHDLKASMFILIEKLTGNLQQRNMRKRHTCSVSQDSQQNTTMILNTTLTLKYVHWCVDSALWRTFLHHICIKKKEGKDFINKLCKSYKKIHRWRWYLSMTTCTEIKLVKVRYSPQTQRIHWLVEQLSHVYNEEEAVICTFKGDILPNLSEQNEYTYNIDLLNLEKEIHILQAERALIDYYHGYKKCHTSDQISQLILEIPHRITGTKLGLKGYRIWAQQGWTLSRLATFTLITQGWAVVFVAFWLWYHSGDLQNAFFSEHYSLELVTVFVAVPDIFLTWTVQASLILHTKTMYIEVTTHHCEIPSISSKGHLNSSYQQEADV